MKKLLLCFSILFLAGNFSITHGQILNNIVVDSTATIKDSLNVMGRAVIQKRLIAKDGIRVYGTARFEENLRILGNLRTEGNTILQGNVRLDSIGNIPNAILNAGTMEFLVVLPNGQMKKGTLDDLIGLIYKKPDVSFLCDNPNPYWASEINKIYSSCPNVRVGVANDDPQHQLDVRGTSYSEQIKVGIITGENSALINGYISGSPADLLKLGRYVGATQQDLFKINSTGGTTLVNKGSSTSLDITNGTGNAIVIKKADGTKILQLENSGLLRSREIRIDQITWADYVFDKNYNLISLEEVAKYIKNYKHLPGIPSQKQIARDGLNLGDMQRLQMEKIEELTLYTIQQDQQIKDLQNENEILNNKLNALEKEMQVIKDMIIQSKN